MKVTQLVSHHIKVLQKLLRDMKVLQKGMQYVLQYFQNIATRIAKSKKYSNNYCKFQKVL